MPHHSPKDDPSRTTDTYPLARAEQDWQVLLSPAEYHVLREGGTEPPFVGALTDETRAGRYTCRACGTEVFSSDTKFASHCGWPSFFAPTGPIEYLEDDSLGVRRIEIRCGGCGSHLGHVFEGEGYPTPTDRRYCVNSIALSLDAAGVPPTQSGEIPIT